MYKSGQVKVKRVPVTVQQVLNDCQRSVSTTPADSPGKRGGIRRVSLAVVVDAAKSTSRPGTGVVSVASGDFQAETKLEGSSSDKNINAYMNQLLSTKSKTEGTDRVSALMRVVRDLSPGHGKRLTASDAKNGEQS